MKHGIQDRSFDFAVRIIKLANRLPENKTGYVVGKQLLRSGTSIGANVEEAEAAFTKSLFCFKMNIALSEARETHYWLRLLNTVDGFDSTAIEPILQEADELKNILGAIVRTSRGASKRKV
jgi:four helix bundle protein